VHLYFGKSSRVFFFCFGEVALMRLFFSLVLLMKDGTNMAVASARGPTAQGFVLVGHVVGPLGAHTRGLTWGSVLVGPLENGFPARYGLLLRLFFFLLHVSVA
jgi:hypothetical protein